jgi:hypothetical protein
MARCGCTSSCSCVVTGSAPVTVAGNGSAQNPYVVRLEYDGQQGCDAITACVGDNAGLGLVYDDATGRLQVHLSGDAGQVARFGSDGGVYTPADGEAPTPQSCVRTIATLPAAPSVVGADSLAGLHNPYNSPQGLAYCVAHGIDLIGVAVSATSDDVGWLAEYDNGVVDMRRCSAFVTQDARQMQSDTIANLRNYAGSITDPFPVPSPDPGDDRQGGWYGWMAQTYYNWMLPEFLQRLGGKGVAVLHCHVSGDSMAAEDVNVKVAVRAILQQCAQDWAMIAVKQIVNATTVINAGMMPVLAADTPADWGETTLPYPVATVTAAGVKWMLVDHYYADSVFAAYRDAGINVLMWGASRQADRLRVATLGIRGGYSLDPVYYRGILPQYGYRATSDPWEHRHVALGQLTFATDQRQVAGTNTRGYCEASEQGLVLPPGWGGGLGRPSVLCGWECPITDPVNYSITWDMKAMGALPSPVPFTAKMGLLFGADSDADTYAWPQGDPANNPLGLPEGNKAMYRAWQRLNGEIGLGVWVSQSAAFTTLATASTPAVAADVWNSYSLTVSPAGIVFTRTLSNGTQYSVTTSDVTHRGPYFFIEKEESIAGSPAAPFRAKWRNVLYHPAPPGAAIFDSFNRTVAGGWGSADTGQTWTTSGGSASDYSVQGA